MGLHLGPSRSHHDVSSSDTLRQQDTASCFAPASQERESGAPLGTSNWISNSNAVRSFCSTSTPHPQKDQGPAGCGRAVRKRQCRWNTELLPAFTTSHHTESPFVLITLTKRGAKLARHPAIGRSNRFTRRQVSAHRIQTHRTRKPGYVDPPCLLTLF